MVLAKLLQTAGARGLVSCQGSRYVDLNGIESMNANTKTVACCVMGASALDGEYPWICVDGLAEGNDCSDGDGTGADDDVGFTLGAAFEQALRPE